MFENLQKAGPIYMAVRSVNPAAPQESSKQVEDSLRLVAGSKIPWTPGLPEVESVSVVRVHFRFLAASLSSARPPHVAPTHEEVLHRSFRCARVLTREEP